MMKLNELINVLYNIKVNILLENKEAKSIYNGLVECLKDNTTNFKNYNVICIVNDIDKDLVILVEEVK